MRLGGRRPLARSNGLAVAAIVGALVVAGCGSDEEPSVGGTSSPPAAATSDVTDTAATDLPSSGPTASQPETTDAATTVPEAGPSTSESASGTSAPPQGDADACSALDAVDLDGLLGEPAGTPELEEDDFGEGCLVPGQEPESRGTVVLRVTTNSAAENYENAREQFGVDAEITGLGDEAFASGAMVVVLSGDRLLTLQAVRWDDLGIDGVTQPELEAAMAEVLDDTGW